MTEPDEFDVYFAKAAALQIVQESARQSDESARRGSLPDDSSSSRLRAPGQDDPDKHKRTFSCKVTRPNGAGGSPSCARAAGGGGADDRRLSVARVSDAGRRGSATGAGGGLLSPPDLAPNGGDISTSTSAPQSRSGSFKRMSRPRSMRDFQEVYGSGGGAPEHSGGSRRGSAVVTMEETIAAKMDELQRLDDEDCCVIRSFVTSPSGLVNRGDSVRRKSSACTGAASVAAAATVAAASAGNGTGGGRSLAVPKSESLARIVSRDAACQVLILGDRGVGKTSLVTQFMTSEYLGALDSSFEIEGEKTISVHLNDVETLLNVVEVQTSTQQDYDGYPAPSCYVLIYSITDRRSYDYVIDVLRHRDVTRDRGACAVILVANKSDLVRKRQISESEAKDVCAQYGCKYIEVSAALNHKIDELLVGVVTQIRLRESAALAQQQQPRKGGAGGAGCSKTTSNTAPKTEVKASGSRGFLKKLFFRHKEAPRPCENLMVL